MLHGNRRTDIITGKIVTEKVTFLPRKKVAVGGSQAQESNSWLPSTKVGNYTSATLVGKVMGSTFKLILISE